MLSVENIKNIKELEFAVFCIENVADKLEKDTVKVYEALVKSELLNGYIIPEYEVLHTQGKEYIIDDIIRLMEERGVEV